MTDDLTVELAPTFGVRGIRLEEKESIKRRLGHSPDTADALALAVSGAADPAGAADVWFL